MAKYVKKTLRLLDKNVSDASNRNGKSSIFSLRSYERRGVFQQTSPVVIRTGTSIAASISSSSAAAHRAAASVVSTSPRLAGGLLDVDGCALERRVVQSLDCFGGVLLASHVNEAVAVHYVAFGHLAEAQEQVAQLIASAVLRQPANEDLCLPLF